MENYFNPLPTTLTSQAQINEYKTWIDPIRKDIPERLDTAIREIEKLKPKLSPNHPYLVLLEIFKELKTVVPHTRLKIGYSTYSQASTKASYYSTIDNTVYIDPKMYLKGMISPDTIIHEMVHAYMHQSLLKKMPAITSVIQESGKRCEIKQEKGRSRAEPLVSLKMPFPVSVGEDKLNAKRIYYYLFPLHLDGQWNCVPKDFRQDMATGEDYAFQVQIAYILLLMDMKTSNKTSTPNWKLIADLMKGDKQTESAIREKFSRSEIVLKFFGFGQPSTGKTLREMILTSTDYPLPASQCQSGDVK